jgi:SHS2 domain-containing protein
MGKRPIARFAEHVGELKLELRADTLEEIFAEAARVVSRECGRVTGAPREWEILRLSARDRATLLVDWINELIGRSEVNQLAYRESRDLRLTCNGGDGCTLAAEIRGWPVRIWQSPLKAATYHGLVLRHDGGRWKAEVLIDV